MPQSFRHCRSNIQSRTPSSRRDTSRYFRERPKTAMRPEPGTPLAYHYASPAVYYTENRILLYAPRTSSLDEMPTSLPGCRQLPDKIFP